VQCRSPHAIARVLSYYRQVDDNAIFYGTMRRELASQAQVHNSVGGDWLFAAGMAYRGRLATDPQTRIHRDAGGSSQDRRKMAASLGVSAWEAWLPVTLSLAVNAARDVAWRNSAYRAAPFWERAALVLLVPCCIVIFKPAQEIARRWRRRHAQHEGTASKPLQPP
jgi:hypothetical protein